MLKYFKCSRRSFFQLGGILGMVMTTTAMAVVMQCQGYRNHCPMAYYCTWLVAACASLMGLCLCCIGCSISHISNLSEADLGPTAMQARTKRWGTISKTCPCLSRWLLTLTGLMAFGGLMTGTMSCPPKGSATWGEETCEAPFSRPPDPFQDFGLVIGCWLLIAAMGCCASSDPREAPFTYVPVPEDAPDASTRCAILCTRLTHCCHP